MVDLPVPPFIVNDSGDVFVFDDPGQMFAAIEAADAQDLQLFDSSGRQFRTVVDEQTWHLDKHPLGEPEPDRVAAVLRHYFARLPKELSAYTARAHAMSRLDELVALRQELRREPAPGRTARLFRRKWG